MVTLCFKHLRSHKIFKVTAFSIPISNDMKIPILYTSMAALLLSVTEFSHPRGCKMGSHCEFDPHFLSLSLILKFFFFSLQVLYDVYLAVFILV